MPDLNIKIGGHDFQMACSPGEEAALEAAANLLDQEAKDLNSNNQKLPESKMLLMISLIMADKLLNQDKSPANVGNSMSDHNITEHSTNSDRSPVLSKQSFNRLSELVTQAEAIANYIEEKT